MGFRGGPVVKNAPSWSSRSCCCFLIAQYSIYYYCSSIIDSDYYCFVLPRKEENVPLLYSLLPRLTWTLKQNNLCSKPFKTVWQIVCPFQFYLGLRTNIWQMWTCSPLSPFSLVFAPSFIWAKLLPLPSEMWAASRASIHVSTCLPAGVLWPHTHPSLSFNQDISPKHQEQS